MKNGFVTWPRRRMYLSAIPPTLFHSLAQTELITSLYSNNRHDDFSRSRIPDTPGTPDTPGIPGTTFATSFRKKPTRRTTRNAKRKRYCRRSLDVRRDSTEVERFESRELHAATRKFHNPKNLNRDARLLNIYA